MGISKKVRFEVFKRDSFSCQYCGRVPPAVVLEVDHVLPKKHGGRNNQDNLVTSCFDCNRGKSANLLTSIPENLKDKAKKIKEREDQVRSYNRLLSSIRRRKNKDICTVEQIFSSYFPKWEFNERFRRVTMDRFLEKMCLPDIQDSMHIACGKMTNSDSALRYFCGVCWNRITEIEEGSDV